jgi:hypothetical protein
MGSDGQRRKRDRKEKLRRTGTPPEPHLLRGPQQNTMFPFEGTMEGIGRLADVARSPGITGPFAWWRRVTRRARRQAR